MRAQRGAVSIVLAAVLVAAAVGGAGVGVALDQVGVFGTSAGATVVVDPGAVGYAVCPGGAQAGRFHQNDRVYLTGRTKQSDWVEVRDPAAPDARVWVVAAVVAPDADLSTLPVHPCETPTAPTTSPTTTTTAAAPEDTPDTPTTTTTTRPGATAPPAPPPAGGGSTGGGTPPPPADTTGPAINQASVSPGALQQLSSGGTPCPNGLQAITKVNAIVTDPSGVASVSVSWDGAEAGSHPMSGNGNTYDSTVGPFSNNFTTFGNPVTLTVTITARDGVGNVSTFPLKLVVGYCK